jgi:hypothetical protein
MRVLRTYARAYTANLDEAVTALSGATGQPVVSRFSMPDGLELAAVGGVLVVAGDEETLAPFRGTSATLIVDDLRVKSSSSTSSGTRPSGGERTARKPAYRGATHLPSHFPPVCGVGLKRAITSPLG